MVLAFWSVWDFDAACCVVDVGDLAARRVGVGGQPLVRVVRVRRCLARRVGHRGQQTACVAVRHRRGVRQAHLGQQSVGAHRERGGAAGGILDGGELAGGVRQAQPLARGVEHRGELAGGGEGPLGVVRCGEGVVTGAFDQLGSRARRSGVRAVTRLRENERRPVVRPVGHLPRRDRQFHVERCGPAAPQQADSCRVGAVGALQGERDTRTDQGGVSELFEEHARRRVDRVGTVGLRVAGADARLRAGDVGRVERLHQRRGGPARARRPVGAVQEDPGVVLLAVLKDSAQRAARPPETLVGGIGITRPPVVAPGPGVRGVAAGIVRGLLDLLLDHGGARLVQDVQPHPGVRRAPLGQLHLPADGQHAGVRGRPGRYRGRVLWRRRARRCRQALLGGGTALRSLRVRLFVRFALERPLGRVHVLTHRRPFVPVLLHLPAALGQRHGLGRLRQVSRRPGLGLLRGGRHGNGSVGESPGRYDTGDGYQGQDQDRDE